MGYYSRCQVNTVNGGLLRSLHVVLSLTASERRFIVKNTRKSCGRKPLWPVLM